MIRLWPYLTAGALILGLGLYSWGLRSERNLAQSERDTAISNAAVFEQSLNTEREAKTKAESLNKKTIEELRNAKSEIDSMRAAVESGTGELRVNAECHESRSMPESSANISKPNATGPRLSESAQRNYFLLRERHAEAISQINGLQGYIREFCQ